MTDKLFRFYLAGAFAGDTVDQHGETAADAEAKIRADYAKRNQKIRIRKIKELKR